MPATHDEISTLAYRLWQERGEPAGSPEVDWERAEATLQLKAVNLVQNALESDSALNSNGDRLSDGFGKTSAFDADPVLLSSVADSRAANSPELPNSTSAKTTRSSKRKSAAK